MYLATRWDWWLAIGRTADLVTILGVTTLALSYKQLARKLFARRIIQTRILPIERRFKGLVCLVSAPFPASDPREAPAAIQRLIRNQESLSQELLDRRIGSALKAIQHHLGELQHCWFVASEDSKVYAALLQEACKKYFPGVRVHEPVIVADVSKKIDDALAAVHGIFERCDRETHGEIHACDIITDITGGNKIMSVAAAFACLDADRSIEYIAQQDRRTLYEIEITLEKVVSRGRRQQEN